MGKKEFKEKPQLNHNFRLNWTGSKVALVELLYALHSGGYFNNGAYVLKEVVAYFESVFNVDLGQYHRVFIEIKARKSDKARFINVLKEVLLKRKMIATNVFSLVFIRFCIKIVHNGVYVVIYFHSKPTNLHHNN